MESFTKYIVTLLFTFSCIDKVIPTTYEIQKSVNVTSFNAITLIDVSMKLDKISCLLDCNLNDK